MNNRELKKLISLLNQFNGVQFIGISDYNSTTTGEVSNYILNANISVQKVKENDLQKLLSVTENQLEILSTEKNISLDVFKVALSEMVTSAEKNLSENVEDRTNQSQAQNDGYIWINKAIKLHIETGQIFMFGLIVAKQVKVPGVYKQVKSREKTLAKKAIKKILSLQSEKFRQFKIDNPSALIKAQGETFEIA